MAIRVSKIKARSKLWSGGKDCVLIAEYKLSQCDIVEIRIDYKDKSGNVLYANIYQIKPEDAKKYPNKFISGMNNYIVPIDDMEKIDVRY